MLQRKVTAIPATISRYTAMPINSMKKRRVAGYARVSTDQEDQVTSYEAQVEYYTNYIKNRNDWEFVKVYTDEGISGTNTKKREGFNTMVADALAGKIDLIVTRASIFILKKKTSGRWIPRASCSSPSCPVLRRKRAGPFQRT